jgi:hypothetical protein
MSLLQNIRHGTHPNLPNCTIATGALDLSLLLEVTELYCLVSPDDLSTPNDRPPNWASVRPDILLGLQHAVEAAPANVRAEFAAASGTALLSMAEYLVEDVLLEGSGATSAAAAAANSIAAGPQAAGQGSTSGTSRHAPAGTQRGGSSSTSSSSSRTRRPKAGGGNPAVTLEQRVTWAQEAVTTLCILTRRQDIEWLATTTTTSLPGLGGEAP